MSDYGIFENGVVRRDREYKENPSRGFYICVPGDGRFYLHHDGTVKNGVLPASGEPAFWESEKAAQEFLDNWRKDYDPL